MSIENWLIAFVQDATGVGQLALGIALLVIAMQIRGTRTELKGLRDDLVELRTTLRTATDRVSQHGEAIARLEGWLERHNQ